MCWLISLTIFGEKVRILHQMTFCLLLLGRLCFKEETFILFYVLIFMPFAPLWAHIHLVGVWVSQLNTSIIRTPCLGVQMNKFSQKKLLLFLSIFSLWLNFSEQIPKICHIQTFFNRNISSQINIFKGDLAISDWKYFFHALRQLGNTGKIMAKEVPKWFTTVAYRR